MESDSRTSGSAAAAATASPSRRRYFWVGQACTALCLASIGLLFIAPGLGILIMVPGVAPGYVILALQGPFAALIGAFAPAVPRARVFAAVYGVVLGVALATYAAFGFSGHRKQQADALHEAGNWSALEAALDPWPMPVPNAALEAMTDLCMDGSTPPLALFERVVGRSYAHATLKTAVAAACGAEATRFLLAHGGSVVPKHGASPSPLALARDDETFALLRAAGATVEQRDPEYPKDQTPIFFAYNADAIRRLHAAGANVLVRDSDGDSPLHQYAYRFGCDDWCAAPRPDRFEAERVEALLALGVPVDIRNDDGRTPLNMQYLQTDTTRVLLRHGADPDAKDNDGRSARHSLDRELLGEAPVPAAADGGRASETGEP